MLFAMLLLAAGPAQAVPTNQQEWIGLEDYPAEARRLGQTGTVAFELTVDERGMVTACRVTGSSSYPVLDTQTCTLIQQRARVTAATGSGGHPVTAHYASRVHWALPAEPAVAAANWASYGHLVIANDGKILSCTEDKSGAPPDSDFCATFAHLPPSVALGMRGGADGKSADVVFETHFRVDGQSSAPARYEAPGRTLVSLISSSFVIDETGRVRDCKVVRTEGNAQFHVRICSNMFDGPYTPMRSATGAPVERKAGATIAISAMPVR